MPQYHFGTAEYSSIWKGFAMLIKDIITGPVRLTTGSQMDQLETVVRKLRDFDKPATIILDSGQKIVISKVLDGGNSSDHCLSVAILG